MKFYASYLPQPELATAIPGVSQQEVTREISKMKTDGPIGSGDTSLTFTDAWPPQCHTHQWAFKILIPTSTNPENETSSNAT